MNFTGAGMLFTNGRHVLGGLGKRGLDGFGGKREGNESYFRTALRETIEELFDFKGIPEHVYLEFAYMVPIRTIYSNGYMTLVFSFVDLELLLVRLLPHVYYTPMYTYFPTTITDLVLNRTAKISEVGQLCLLPISKDLHISSCYTKDINTLAAV
jgi:hypothetical protein